MYFNVRFDILPLLNEKLALQYLSAKGDDVVVLDVLIFYLVFGFEEVGRTVWMTGFGERLMA
jgi:hypothetical protein